MADQDLVDGDSATPEGTRGGAEPTAAAARARATTNDAQSPSGPSESRQESNIPPSGGTISRRLLLGTAGATGLALGAAGGAAGYAAGSSSSSSTEKAAPLSSLGAGEVMFHVKHQPGITTPSRHAATSSRSTWPPGQGARRPPLCCAAGRRRPGG